MHGKLFTQDFLHEGITRLAAWRRICKSDFQTFRERLRNIFAAFPAESTANEAVTETDLIFKILEALGWRHYLQQQAASGKGRLDVPDILLFQDEQHKQRAQAERRDERRYRHGIVIVESKRWRRPLDRGAQADALDPGTPSNQMLRYLSRAEVASDKRIQWGVLTNGRHWRLYYQQARSRSEEFLELDLANLVGLPGLHPDLYSFESSDTQHYLRVFYLLFGRIAFLPQLEDAQRRSAHAIGLAESRHWEERVSQDLGSVVFQRIFVSLVEALAKYDLAAPSMLDADHLEIVRRASLILLYRLLFVLYAEDRNLLPVQDSRYDNYSLRAIREDIAARVDRNDVFSATATRYHNHLQDLFAIVGRGDSSLGVPPYNGGLFDDAEHPLLARSRLPDAVMAEIIDGLSRRSEGDTRRWVNYRDLSVQHLGSVYERLLEYAVVTDDHGQISIRPNIFARKGSGSYYTHDDLVKLIIDRTIGPLIAEKVETFRQRSEALSQQRTLRAETLRALEPLDPAVNILELRICDPAMGSGHFLVSLIDYLADHVLEEVANATVMVAWRVEEQPYQSPLVARIAHIRERILASALASGWNIDPAQLDDRHIVRRMILKRVIYGVDKNPMAVELAKVALWLHSFTVGAPLSFLDHHLVTGDALYGERVRTVVDDLHKLGAMFHHQELTRIAVATDSMNRLSELTDVDIAEAHESQRLFDQIRTQLRPLQRLLDFWHALRWIAPVTSKAKLNDEHKRGLAELLSGRLGDLMEVVKGESPGQLPKTEDALDAEQLLNRARELVAREGFLHWEVAFPTVWRGLEDGYPRGGFDAVIGNPPWDRMKLQEVEWFAARKPEIARAGRASDRKRMIAQLQKEDDPWWRLYLAERDQAETAARVARESGNFPLLSKGDINIYSLFVERARSLVAPAGIVGLLTPSGIASDKGASVFFKQIAVGGHLAALLDFENKKVFFPDVDSRFKFCALVFGGSERRFEAARCAFFLHAVGELDDPERSFVLGAADFDAVNPNTGTAPIFRRKRDADITTAIYQRFPVLVDRRSTPPMQVWPVRYCTMFHMTNDSKLFKRRDEMEQEGFYPVEGNRLRKGEEECVPLYEGKMVQMYDHRAASIVVNSKNLHRPAQPEPANLEQHRDVQWLPESQFWLNSEQIEEIHESDWVVIFKEISAPTNMRSMIACIAPAHAFGNKVPVLQHVAANSNTDYRLYAPLLLANFNVYAFDFVVRQKLHGQTLNLFILEQLPMIEAQQYQEQLGGRTIADFIRDQVLHLTYTAVDMRPFARDMGFEGEPFVWDEEDRRHRMARLDALFFHLYGITREDADYILNTFPIVRAQDEKTFGRYLTRDLVLAYMNAVRAGDLDSLVRI
ncbi:MAG: Eco57I restriction-modification methylase domain-containing protein [Gammaproteobacteria bacterium]